MTQHCNVFICKVLKSLCDSIVLHCYAGTAKEFSAKGSNPTVKECPGQRKLGLLDYARVSTALLRWVDEVELKHHVLELGHQQQGRGAFLYVCSARIGLRLPVVIHFFLDICNYKRCVLLISEESQVAQ